ncbi:hypothetical protein Tco_0808575 [Tanacetum coccineum]
MEQATTLNLKVKGNDVPTYTERFQELTLICTKFVANETEKVDKYISGLPNNIYGNVKFARPKTLDETIELANDLMDQKLRAYAERQSDNKRKADDSSRNNHGHQQQPFKRQNVAKVYQYGGRRKKRRPYGDLCPNAQVPSHHNGHVPPRVPHKAMGQLPRKWLFDVWEHQGHFKGDIVLSERIKMEEMGMHKEGCNIQLGMQKKRGKCTGYPEPISYTKFYDVELADEKISRDRHYYTRLHLNSYDHSFNIYLMPVELGSFDVIIVCDEKLVQVPYGNETLTFCSNESSNGGESRLIVISCSKAQEYMVKGCHVFLAQISAKKEEDKSEGKQIKDVPIVRDFPEVFPEEPHP